MDDLDPVWKALSDPTRRQILDVLREGPQSTGALCARFSDLSRFGVMKHLDALEAAQLVVVRREGRNRWNHLNVIPIAQIYDRWIRPYEATWSRALLDLKEFVEGET